MFSGEDVDTGRHGQTLAEVKVAGLTGEFLNAVARELAEWNDRLAKDPP
jgi:hypothetical protein